ncbi:AI-2E family transporter [Cellulosimicrobium cellulans]|uniref:AI-2E family transporter n=1 Tax=Cellulosimicrobium cellulans TaxID=1710 RepID=UPI001ED9E868|nr:AI-2E family transporter [Cellulosimicrobium cellulans]UKJ65588.1 AI-2E family transporter [Cellulosimicrobium cellulans]
MSAQADQHRTPDPLPPGRPGAAAVPDSVRSAAAWSWRLLLIGLTIAAGLWLVTQLKVIVVPIAVALLLTVLLTPVQRFFRRHLRMSRGLASGAALITLVVVVAGLVAIAGQQIVSGFQDLRDQAVEGFEQFTAWLADGPLGLDSTTISHWLDQAGTAVSENQDSIVSGALGAATTIGHVVAGALIALFCTFFFLLDGRTIWSWVVGLLPLRARDDVHQAGRRGIVTLAAYTRTQILVAAVDAVGIGIGAAFFVPSLALPLGILVFVGSFIPIVGAIVTGSIAVLVVLVAQGWVQALIMLGIVLLVQQIEGHILQPFLMGHAVSLHPVAVLLVVAAGSFAAGIVGALFAVPIAAVLNTVVLYLHGHDKFPELGTDDRVVVRGSPQPPVIARAEADLEDVGARRGTRGGAGEDSAVVGPQDAGPTQDAPGEAR